MSQPTELQPTELQPTTSVDSTNSTTPFKQKNNERKDYNYMHTPQESNEEDNYATMIIKGDELQRIRLELKQQSEERKKANINNDNDTIAHQLHSPSDASTMNHAEYSQSLSHKTGDSAAESITNHTDFSNKIKLQESKQPNPLDTTTLRHDGNDIEIGVEEEEINTPQLHPARMPSISYNTRDTSVATLRRASRRKWWSPTRVCDWCMHKVFFGKIMIMILTWTTVLDYSKDIYVAYHFVIRNFYWEFFVTLSILFLSLRLMLYLRAIDEASISFWKLFLFYLPGSVYFDFQIDRASDIGVCIFWEIAILFGTPFVPFFLIYLAMRKSVSLFCGGNSFENPYLLSYAVVECVFETVPQLTLQTYLYFAHWDEIELVVFVTAWVVSILVLIKIPIVVWYNWRIVYKLSFKRRHCGEIISLAYHPQQDLIATGSWDHTVLINSIIMTQDENVAKAKRVLDHHYNINCIVFSNRSYDILAVAGQGVELFNWRSGRSIGQLPKTRERDQLRRRKRHRTKEVKCVLFSPDSARLIWCAGKNVLVWDLAQKKELLKIKCIEGNRLGDVECIDISPNGKYICAGLYQNQIKVYNSYNKDLIRVLEGHTSPVMCCKFDRDGKYIISGGADAKIRLFDLRSGQQLCESADTIHSADVMCIAIDPTNRYIASGGRDKILNIVYLETLTSIKKWRKYKTKRDIRCCDFSPYGDTVACATEDHEIHILSLPKECHVQNTRKSDKNVKRKVIQASNKHQQQYSNIEVITTNQYNKFDPKEHNIF